MALSTLVYNTFMKRNAVFVSTIFAGSFTFSLAFDSATTAFWERHNRGKLWPDIREKVATT